MIVVDDIGGPLLTPGQREARHRLATVQELHLPLLGGPAQGHVLTRERGRPWREGETVRVPVTRDVMVATFGMRDSRPVPIAFADEWYMVHATTSGRLIGLHVGSLPDLLHEPAWRINVAFSGIDCHCHDSAAGRMAQAAIAARAAGVPLRAVMTDVMGYDRDQVYRCGQCGHGTSLHTDEPGQGCLTAECLCLNTPALI